jgi:peptidoglycan hydrolase CwlO-like protein
MKKQKKLLKEMKESFNDKLSALEAYLTELQNMVKKHGTEDLYCKAIVSKAEHDLEYYRQEIDNINKSLNKPASDAS